jgi:hypothetical protein
VNAERMQLLMIRGAIAEMPECEQAKVRECRGKLAAVVKAYAQFGQIALSLAMIELVVGELE